MFQQVPQKLPKKFQTQQHYMLEQNVTKILTCTSSYKNIDIKQQAEQEIAEQIIQDEQNQFDFYNITNYDRQKKNKKTGTNFKSRNSLTDVQYFLGESKIFEQKKLNPLQIQEKTKIKKDLGKFQLLSEIYEQMEQEQDYRLQQLTDQEITKQKLIEINRTEIQNLDDFTKNMKLKRNQCLGLEPQPKKEQVKTLPSIYTLPSLPKSSSIIKLQSNFSNNHKENSHSKLIQIQNSKPNIPPLPLKRKFQAKQIDATEFEDLEIKNEDRDIKKKLFNYMVESESLQQRDIDQDITPAGIINNLKSIYEIDISEMCKNILQKSKYYEKKSCFVYDKIINKIVNNEASLQSSSKLERLLILENHSLNNRIIKEREQIEQLLKDTQADKIAAKLEKTRKFSLKNGSISDKLIQNHKRNQSQNRMQQIENMMIQNQIEQEIEQKLIQLQKLKNNIPLYEQKLIENKKTIQDLEIDISNKKKQIKKCNESLKNFFLEILKFGKDCRNEGLSWIVQKMQKIGIPIDQKIFPSFLDQKAYEFIIQKTQKQIELLEYQNLLQSELDNYKINIEERKNIEQRLNQKNQEYFDNDSDSNSDIHKTPSITNTISKNASYIDSSYLSPCKSLPMIINNSINQSISSIDADILKKQESYRKKQQQSYDLSQLKLSLDENSSNILDNIVEQMIKTKLTTNDMIYSQARQILVQQIIQTKKYENGYSKNDTISIKETATELPFKLLLFENNKQINNYNNRNEFIKEYNHWVEKIKKHEKEIAQLDDIQANRIIKEFDLNQYGLKFKIDCPTVLAALFGAIKTEHLIVKFGLNQK